MLRRSRIRGRSFWPGCFCGHPHHFWVHGPVPPPWWVEKPTPEDEKEELREHIGAMKEELAAAEDYLKKLEEGQ